MHMEWILKAAVGHFKQCHMFGLHIVRGIVFMLCVAFIVVLCRTRCFSDEGVLYEKVAVRNFNFCFTYANKCLLNE